MRRIIVLIIATSLFTSGFSLEATAETNQGFFKNLGDIFQGKNSKKKKSRKRRSAAQIRVASIQSHLNTLGYDAGPADGYAGAKTRSAISAYKAAKGFPETGDLTKSEYTTLENEAKAEIAANTPDPSEAQSDLKEMGFYSGEVDGNWGPASQNALNTFRSFVALPTGGPLNMNDLATLQEAVIATSPKPAVSQPVFDTITLFGNEFALSEPLLAATELTWADVRPHTFAALPQAKAMVMDPDETKSLIDQKTSDLDAAYQAQIDVLYALVRPQIQTYVENSRPSADVPGAIENFDIELALYLMAGKGLELIDLLGISTPGVAEVITITQSTTYQLQALQALSDNILSVAPAG